MREIDTVLEWNNRVNTKADLGWGSNSKISNWPQVKTNYLKKLVIDDGIKSILDICCGKIDYIVNNEWFKNINYYKGIDGAPKNIEHNSKLGFKTDLMTVSELIKTDLNKNVECITMFDMIFHIPEKELYENLLKWVFDKSSAKFVIITYSNRNPSDNYPLFKPRDTEKYLKNISTWSITETETSIKDNLLHISVLKRKN